MLGSPGRYVRVVLPALLLLAGGCGWLKPLPTPILPPDELYSIGEEDLARKRYGTSDDPVLSTVPFGRARASIRCAVADVSFHTGECRKRRQSEPGHKANKPTMFPTN